MQVRKVGEHVDLPPCAAVSVRLASGGLIEDLDGGRGWEARLRGPTTRNMANGRYVLRLASWLATWVLPLASRVRDGSCPTLQWHC